MSQIFDLLRIAEKARIANAPADAGNVAVATSVELCVEDAGSSSSDVRNAFSKSSADRPPQRQERRKQRRATVRLPVRVRASDLKDGDFDEVLETVNASRGGLRFITTNGKFYPGMRVRITCPYNSQHDCVGTTEEGGEVRRIGHAGDKKLGVAVQLGSSTHSASSLGDSAPCVSHRPHGERRLAIRYPFTATAILFEERSNTRLHARCSDSSTKGCYVDTLNPFPKGTLVHLQLRRAESTFETFALVIANHVGMGMGLMFHEPTLEQTAKLADWLSGKRTESFPNVEQQPAISRRLSDREMLIHLVCLLQAKGLLTKGEVSALLTEAETSNTLSNPIL